MNALHKTGGLPPGGPSTPSALGSAALARPAPWSRLSGGQYRHVARITLVAVALFFIFRFLPTGTNLSHMDFRVQGGNSIEMCDPLNPQFIPVVDVRSPVTMTLAPGPAAEVGREVQGTFTLRTANGKPIAPEDLLIAHTKKLHLLIIDPSLNDYQHVHPDPTRTPGEWAFHFTPHVGGIYRIFADFTPVATGRGLYANTEIVVTDGAHAPVDPAGSSQAEVGSRLKAERRADGAAPASTGAAASHALSWIYEHDGYRFELQPAVQPLRVRQTIDLKFSVSRTDGGPVPMEPVMDAYAHLVAFDEGRSGFAHLHPVETDLSKPPGVLRPTLSFKITIPRPGRYVIWSQVNLGGQEVFAPFWFNVVP